MTKNKKSKLSPEFIGKAIKKARLSKDLSQEELGEKIGVGRSHISKLETGAKKNLTLSAIAQIFEAMESEMFISITDNEGNEVFSTGNKSK